MILWQRLRVIWVEIFLLLVLLVIGWKVVDIALSLRGLMKQNVPLERIIGEYTDIAKHTRAYVDASRKELRDYSAIPSQTYLARYQAATSNFLDWLDERQLTVLPGAFAFKWPSAMKADVPGFLQEVRQATMAYRDEVNRLTTKPLSAQEAREVPDQVSARTQTLRDLAERGVTEAITIKASLDLTELSFGTMKQLAVITLATLSIAALWLALVMYRRVIAPLRARLAATQEILEGQEKLLHFGKLAAMVTHEIRNPLAAIKIRLYTLEKSLPPDSRGKIDALVIQNEIDRLNNIVTEFLETARPRDPVLEPVTADQVFERVEALMGPTCLRHGIKLEVEHNGAGVFLGDAHQIEQVLINLVKNAAESIGHDGKIVLRSKCERVKLHRKMTEAAILEVEDNGPGISQERQPRLFDPFFSTKEGGTGLGLSIALRIINRHCGIIDVFSQPGRTVFRVVLPIHKSTP